MKKKWKKKFIKIFFLFLSGNGLAFDDLDPTFTTENCDYVYNVDCGNRTELEPAISAPNCPRLYGTFMDPDDCTGFFNCRNGIANRYSCAPGLAFDPEDRVCKWADQVSRCKKLMDEEEKKGENLLYLILYIPWSFLVYENIFSTFRRFPMSPKFSPRG